MRSSPLRLALAALCVATIFGIAAGQEPNAPARPTTKPESLAVAHQITAVLPKGWTATAEGDQVVVERSESVQVFNGVGRSAIDGQGLVFPLICRITLRLGDRMSDEQYRQREEGNSRALATAKRDLDAHPQKVELKQYAKWNPKYGYQSSPWLDTGQNSLYVERSFGGFLQFQSKEVEAECHQVDDAIARLFHRYDAK